MCLFLLRVFGVEVFWDVAVGDDGMLGKSARHVGYIAHQKITYAAALLGNGRACGELYGLSKIDLPQPRGNVKRDKGELFARAPVIELCYINKAVLEVIEYIVIFFVIFGEDDDVFPVLKLCERFSEGAENTAVLVYGDSPRVIEYHNRQRSYQI